MLARYDLCGSATRRMRWQLFRINGCAQDLCDREGMNEQLANVVMQTREGLDRAIVLQMIEALWECEG